MSILDKLGFKRKPKADVEKPQIKLHPDCMTRHGTLVSMYLSGSQIEVLNPQNETWEDCPQPIFDPQYCYRLFGNVSVRPVQSVKPLFVPTPAPKVVTRRVNVAPETVTPTSHYKRGDVCQNVDGKTFIVLGSKFDLIADYNPNLDPDSNSLVVMRHDAGMKKAVSTRDGSGRRADNNSKYALGRKVATGTMPVLDHSIAGFTKIMSRSRVTDVYLCNRTGEVKFF